VTSARAQILATLKGTAELPLPKLPEVMTSASAIETPLATRIDSFRSILAKLGAPVDVLADLASAGPRVAAILAEHNATSLAMSDAPAVLELAKSLPTSLELVPHDAPRADLLRSHAGLSTAQWAIAETGTLMLVARHEQHRLATLLVDLHIAIVPASRLLATLGDGFQKLCSNGQPDARTITFVTGPSRTADIELQLVVGVHGPKALHVLILSDC